MTKIGIVGVGGRGFYGFAWPLSQKKEAKLVAVCDTNLERAKVVSRLIKEKTGISPAEYSDYREMLQEKIDLLVVTTPDFTHAEIAIEAMRAGQDVFVDKPLATKTTDCLKIYRTMKETGRRLYLGFNLRYDIVCRRIKEIIESGALGRIVNVVNADFYQGGKTYMARWNRFYEYSGGLFCHKGCHDLDIINWYFNLARPLRVVALAGVNVLHPGEIPFAPGKKRVGPYCRACEVRFHCPDAGRVESPLFSEEVAKVDSYYPDTCIYLSDKDTHDNGFLLVEYEGGKRAFHWECFFTPVSTRRFTIVGTRGHLDADLAKNEIVVYPRWSHDRITYSLVRGEGGHGGADANMLDTLLLAVKEPGAINFTSVREGIMSVVIAEAAELSRRQGRIVEISELIDWNDLAE
ncbi:MAG: Gfo/Idh/MocA family oxidoreductase [Candidatus Omnitrophica bacterium]|nr:Gfo/Idh/MocA family oxidoreductase [Candidatus Omnitrophota bacterium]